MPMQPMPEEEISPAEKVIEIEGLEDLKEEVVIDEDPTKNGKDEHAEMLEQGDEEYGAKVKKRIGKAIYERNIERERVRTLEEENRQLREQQQKQKSDTEISALIAKRDAVKDKIKRAINEGELDNLPDLQVELADLSADIKITSHRVKAIQEDKPQIHPAAKKWLDNNQWFSDDKHKAVRDKAITLQNVMINEEGYTLGDDLYDELNRRLARTNPDLVKAPEKSNSTVEDDEEEEEDPTPTPKTVNSKVSAPPRGTEGREVKSKNKITKSDLETMKRYGFNPNNPVDRKAWLNRNEALT